MLNKCTFHNGMQFHFINLVLTYKLRTHIFLQIQIITYAKSVLFQIHADNCHLHILRPIPLNIIKVNFVQSKLSLFYVVEK